MKRTANNVRGLTVRQLYKFMGKLIEDGHARKRVVVRKDTFTHPLEADGCTVLEVTHASMNSHLMLDDNSYTKTLADGTESERVALTLCGDGVNDSGLTHEEYEIQKRNEARQNLAIKKKEGDSKLIEAATGGKDGEG